jgi:L-ascorbate metabolism protein UlaG (beta-lactamase superfamily)
MNRMRITKFGHSCIRISSGGSDVVIDPGGWSEREALDGVAAVLVTHEHPDHWDVEHLRSTDAPVFTIGAVADRIREADPSVGERVTVVRPGDELTVAGFDVRVVGEKHAVIHPELTHFDNSGYLLTAEGRSVFHPGDSFTLPGREVDVFCGPVCAPWAKMSEVVDLARDVKAPLTVGIHDKTYSDLGLAIVDDRMRAFLEPVGGRYVRPDPGGDV